MMSPCEFRKKWNHVKNGKLITFSSSDFVGLLVSGEAKKFLIEAGLPASAPPYLEFRKKQKFFFKKHNNFNISYHYFPIGTTGAGDFVCIKTKGNI